MSTAYNKIIAKFQALDEYVGYLTELQKVAKKTFLDDYHYYGLAEHYLHLAIEAMMDVAKLLIIAQQFRRPEELQEVFVVLYEKEVLSATLYQQLLGSTGFRNVLIHEYEKIDKERVYEYLQSNIQQFQDFKKQILLFIK